LSAAATSIITSLGERKSAMFMALPGERRWG
jgi:hypothetical protein